MPLPIKPKILIYERGTEGITTFKNQLADLNCDFYSVHDTEEFCQLCLAGDFALVFIDVNSGQNESLFLAEKIRDQENAGSTPIIFISEEKIDHTVTLLGYEVGAVDFITLPIEDIVIKSKTRTFLELYNIRNSLEKNAEERLRTSEGKYKSLFDTSRDGIVFMSLEGNIENANKVYCELLGFNLEDLIFTTSKQHTPEKWWKSDAEIFDNQVMRRDYSDEYKKEYIRKDKTIVPVLVRTSLVRDENGKPLRLLKVVRDISERRKMERQLRQSHKMESVGTLAGGIAHDFNNILGAIIGYAQLAQYNIAKDNPASEDISNIISASGRAKELVTQILGFSRDSEQAMQPVRLNSIVKEVLTLIRASFPSTIEIVKNISTDGTAIVADSTEMHQVVMNICTNAFHAMEKNGGCLTVNLESAEIVDDNIELLTGLKKGNYVRLSIRDNGCGIEPEIVERIFDPYFTTKKKGAGTGLGLSLVHGIIKNHGGWIDVKSSVGEGTEVTVLFPRLNITPVESEQEFPKLLRGKENILFVDDEPSLVYIEKIMLQKLGYNVTSSFSGVDAFELFVKESDFFDIVITDMTMPGMTGLELARKVSEIRPNIAIILCTGYNNKITPDIAGENGISYVLLKPVEIRDLATTIRTCLD